MGDWMSFRDLAGYRGKDAYQDMMAALAVTFISVPQCIAYAVIAGLPPSAGLYAATVPVILGSFFRSSRHVVTGPTNALSLLLGASIASMSGVDPVQAALVLALMVGVFQLLAGLLRLGAIVDYISTPVVLGYITGAGLLIGLGQLPNVTNTAKTHGNVVHLFTFWFNSLGSASWLAVGVALSTTVLIVLLRKINRAIPGPILVLTIATILSAAMNLKGMGLKIVSDLSPVPRGWPPITMPNLSLMSSLLPLAIAATVLSLVESSAIARAIATRTRQRLNLSVEFFGQGLANISAAFFGGYPISGSPSRSSLNEGSGAVSRLAGVFSGFLMVLVLLFFGSVVNYTPVAALAGLLLVVAADIIDLKRIHAVFSSQMADKVAFLATLIGTWALPLDKAIYLGVGLSLILFLRKARLLRMHELLFDQSGRLHEVEPDGSREGYHACDCMQILQLEGRLFFGVAGELQSTLDEVLRNPTIKVLLVRLKRTQDMDVTIASLLAEFGKQMESQGKTMLLAGVRKDAMKVLEETGAVAQMGNENVFPCQGIWFASIGTAIKYAREIISKDELCNTEPLDRYLAQWSEQQLENSN